MSKIINLTQIKLTEYQVWCIDCHEDLKPSELVIDGANEITELFCPHCGSNHFGFYKEA